MKRTRFTILGIALPLVAGLALLTTTASAQQPARATAQGAGYLNAGDLERLAKAEGIAFISEIELEDRLAEVEGRDSQRRKVELVIDRRTGEVLQRKVKPTRAWD